MGFPPQLPHIGLLKYSSGLFQSAIEAQIFFSWKMSLNFLGPSIWFGKICLCPRTTHSRFFVSRYDCQIFNICCGTIGTLATSDNRFSRRIWRTKFMRSGHNIFCISSLYIYFHWPCPLPYFKLTLCKLISAPNSLLVLLCMWKEPAPFHFFNLSLNIK